MSKKILVVDDDRMVLDSLKKLLSKESYCVISVESGKDALEIIKKEEFDLVITDIRMVDINGIELIKKIKQLQAKLNKQKSEFMVITGFADDDVPKEGAKLGIVNFVIKPFDSKVLLEVVKNCLEGKKLELPREQEEEAKWPLIKFPNKCFLVEKTVFLKHTNLMGNTYFADYIIWQGEVREAILFSHPNYREEFAKNQNIKMITHSFYHRFIQETTFGDVVQIKMTSREIKHCSFVLVFRYYNKITGTFLGEGWQRLTFADSRTGSLTTIPGFIRELALAICEDK